MKLKGISLLLPLIFANPCTDIFIPSLEGIYKKAKICCGGADDDDRHQGKLLPLTVYQHGDGWAAINYFRTTWTMVEDQLISRDSKIINKIASNGFCVVAAESCAGDPLCQNGEVSYLEVLKTLVYIEQNKKEISSQFPIDFSQPYTVGGHSTGARVALMVAALKDTVGTSHPYLQGTKAGEGLTDEMKAILPKISAVVADHPDPMADPMQNPDRENYKITKTPVLIITGSKDDIIEPRNAAWLDFQQISTPQKIFVDVKGAEHYELLISADESNAIVNFYRAFGQNNRSQAAFNFFFGTSSSSGLPISSSLKISTPGLPNTGVDQIGYLACNQNQTRSIPSNQGRYCQMGQDKNATRFNRFSQRKSGVILEELEAVTPRTYPDTIHFLEEFVIGWFLSIIYCFYLWYQKTIPKSESQSFENGNDEEADCYKRF